MSLSPQDREALLRAWPWPVEAATTKFGFGNVVAAVEAIVARRVEAARRETWLAAVEALDELPGTSATGYYASGDASGYNEAVADMERLLEARAAIPPP